MKIAFIVGHFPQLSETFILNQITGLIERGHQVDIYASSAGDTTKTHPAIAKYNLLEHTYYFPQIPENIVLRIWKGLGLLLTQGHQDPWRFLDALNVFKYGQQALSLWLLYTIIPKFNCHYDIIHCQFGTQSYRGMSFRTINDPKAKLITTFRGDDISRFVKERGKKVYQKLFHTGNCFLANCEFFKRRVVELGCDESQVFVHRSGLDSSRFTFTPRYFPNDEKIRIVTTGRLVEKKGIEYSIRAVAQQALVYSNIEYNIIGDGPLKDRLQTLINNLNAHKFIHLLGWKDENEIIEILNQSQIFLAPSVTAKDGNQDAPINVLKEAMAMGLPVISTYHGGIPELVEDGVSGFLVPERDAETLAEKLGILIKNPQLWLEMGKAGRTYVEEHYDLNKLNDILVEIYQQTLTSSLPKQNLNVQMAKSVKKVTQSFL
ncbi:glycosyltransferase [Limnoraphis robusta]|uniref:Glycosyltransferase n=1 Tax=Limnoraphis robusta CS-951 TaxID=1637645 RepID=A0A0F5YCC4_9CYAN|nr:glycosyltransferase [Limnoraphis robusta]KKD36536.1 glycosyltransferase [Limnoraphis robusta CS-951]